MQQKRVINIQVKPLNASSGMKIVGDGSFQQKYSRDDNAFYSARCNGSGESSGP